MPSIEKATQAAILQYLTLRGIFHHRNNTGSYSAEYAGRSRYISFGAKGSPDIVCVYAGQYIGIEVKDTKGKLNDNQIKFKEALEEAGGLYLVARSLDDVLNFFQ